MNDPGWTVDFYRDQRGGQPVTEFIRGLGRQMRAKVVRALHLLREEGDRLGMPDARPLAGYPFRELRIQTGGNIVRLFYMAARAGE